MFRFRRYRVFLILSIVSILAVIHFSGFGGWSSFTPVVPVLKPDRPQSAPPASKAPPAVKEQKHVQLQKPIPQPVSPILKGEKDAQRPVPEKPVATPPTTPVVLDLGQESTTPASTRPTPPVVIPNDDAPVEDGKGRLEVEGGVKADAPRWQKQPERFPIASQDVIPLPTEAPKKLPRIQFDFPAESAEAKAAREAKLAKIKSSLRRSWDGYREFAWTHDELRPQSGGFRDPFMGWGATLVDSLDTLWLFGMREEFEEAVRAVGKIDFKTSQRSDIPLFETVIRYLGGLIGAYDISDGQYRTLLDKAIELADILMGAFDTPNRMPVTYYMWAPKYASQKQRAGTRVVLAEIGSLSVEFTRLAQITRNDRYYDAIARITNALEKWQPSTSIPGLWPSFLDASGCHRIEKDLPVQKLEPPKSNPDGHQFSPPQAQGHTKRDTTGPQDDSLLPGEEPANYGSNKFVPGGTGPSPWKGNMAFEPTIGQATVGEQTEACQVQGLNYPPGSSTATYTVASLADSAYEYLPKTYALLGGLNNQYKDMYKQSRDAIMKHIAFRPMLPDSEDVLFVSEATTLLGQFNDQFNYQYRGSHLGCFVGGMFGVGSRIFGLEEDLKIAEKMTEACVWAYNSTTSGIMPEEFTLLPCDGLRGCQWNQTAYIHAVYPYNSNKDSVEAPMVRKDTDEVVVRNPTATYTPEQRLLPTPPFPNAPNPHFDQKIESPARTALAKRLNSNADETPLPDPTVTDPTKLLPGGAAIASSTVVSHSRLAEIHIKEHRIPPGMTQINSAKYILRPEAIESVFIMFRITGNEIWREKGWEMFNAVERATQTKYGNSAILDVTSEAPFYQDEMESFWIGETLKYFYLLFSEPDVLSLDEYVLNTEAHPHRRPLPL